MRRLNKDPTSFENWIFNKIFVPMIILISIFVGIPLMYDSISYRNSCEELCFKKGSLSFKVAIKPRRCFCYLSEEQMTKGAYETRTQVYPKT